MEWIFQPLTQKNLEKAAVLCDNCVGKNLYSPAYLASVLKKPEHCFRLLTNQDGEIAGYIYFFLARLEDMAELSKFPVERLAAVFGRRKPVIGNLQSVGVDERWRGRGLSRLLVSYYLNYIQFYWSADVAFGVFWKPGKTVPMEKTLKRLSFRYLGDARHVWYDREDLVCPYCRGRCRCDAAVYYRPLGKEEQV